MKKCGLCKLTKAYIEFYNNASTADGYSWHCKNCHKNYSRESKMGRYGLTKEQFEYLLNKQDNRCAICQKPFNTENWPRIDHDHACCPISDGSGGLITKCGGKCVRGLLCVSCNSGLGMFNDNLERVVSAANYLKSFLGTDYPMDIVSLDIFEIEVSIF